MIRAFQSYWLPLFRFRNRLHVIIMNESHLRGILHRYFHYDNSQRTHLGIKKDSPEQPEVKDSGKIDKAALVNGLHQFCSHNNCVGNRITLFFESCPCGPKEIYVIVGGKSVL